MEISTGLAFTMIERLLGGDGEKGQETRSFTEIELTLLRGVLTRILDIFPEAWENVIELKPKLEKIEINSQFAQIVSPNETIALATMNVSIGEVEGMFNICIPHLVIEPILNRLSTKLWFSNAQRTEDEDNKDKDKMSKRIKRAAVTVRAQLGSTTASLKEVMNLNVGDVIKLDTKTDEQLRIFTGRVEKFYGLPGTNKNKLAVKLTDVKKDGDDADD